MKLSACNKDITPHKRGRTAFIVVALPLVFLILLSASCDEGGGGKNRSEPVAAVVERSRDANQTNDFLRLIFLPANVVPTTLGRPDALRVFVSVTSYFEPPLPFSKRRICSAFWSATPRGSLTWSRSGAFRKSQ